MYTAPQMCLPPS